VYDGTQSQNATYLEFSLNWVFQRVTADLNLLSVKTTGVRPMYASASLIAWDPGSSRDSLKASRDGSTLAMFGLAS
jgi:hypothetical protein